MPTYSPPSNTSWGTKSATHHDHHQLLGSLVYTPLPSLVKIETAHDQVTCMFVRPTLFNAYTIDNTVHYILYYLCVYNHIGEILTISTCSMQSWFTSLWAKCVSTCYNVKPTLAWNCWPFKCILSLIPRPPLQHCKRKGGSGEYSTTFL